MYMVRTRRGAWVKPSTEATSTLEAATYARVCEWHPSRNVLEQQTKKNYNGKELDGIQVLRSRYSSGKDRSSRQ